MTSEKQFQTPKKIFAVISQSLSLHSAKREFSSAGSEHLPYKQRVGGSNPSTPTGKGFQVIEALYYLLPSMENY